MQSHVTYHRSIKCLGKEIIYVLSDEQNLTTTVSSYLWWDPEVWWDISHLLAVIWRWVVIVWFHVQCGKISDSKLLSVSILCLNAVFQSEQLQNTGRKHGTEYGQHEKRELTLKRFWEIKFKKKKGTSLEAQNTHTLLLKSSSEQSRIEIFLLAGS